MNALCFNSLLFDDVSESVSKLLAGTRRCNDFIDHVIFVSFDARANWADAWASARVGPGLAMPLPTRDSRARDSLGCA